MPDEKGVISKNAGMAVLFILAFLSFLYYFSLEYNAYIFDDAFITYRYAVNLANGNGLVYNAGEKVFGTTALLYALLLGGIKLLTSGIPIHIVSQIISLICFNLIFIYLYIKHSTEIFFISLLYGLAFFNVYVNKSVFSGMETMLVMLLLIFSLSNFGKRIFFFLIPLVVIARIDAAFVLLTSVFILQTYYFIRHKDRRVRLFKDSLLILAGIAAGFAISFIFFETIIPNTILAKNVIYRGTAFNQSFWFRFSQMRNFGYPAIISVPLLILIFYLFFSMRRKSGQIGETSVLMGLFSLLYFLFQISLVTSSNIWYIAIQSFSVIILLALLLSKTEIRKIYLHVTIVLALLLNLLYSFNAGAYFFQNHRNSVHSSELYHVSGLIEENSKIFCGDIGVIGYFRTSSYVYDYAGLVTPKAIEFNKKKRNYGDKGISTDYNAILEQVLIEKPDYVNFRNYPFFQGVKDDSVFKSQYEIIFAGKDEMLYKKR